MNNRLTRNWLLTLSIVGAVFGANVASAQTTVPSVPKAPTLPSECTAKRDSTAWTSSKAAGESRVNAIWKSNAVAQDLDKLSAALPAALDSLEQFLTGLSSGTPTTYIQCRAQGYTEGFLFALNKLFKACVLDGAEWGQFGADLYCRMSIEYGGLAADTLFLRAPVGVCGNLTEYTCEEVYRHVGSEGTYTVSPYVQSYLTHEGITLEPYPGCGIYSDGEFLEAFEGALHNDCTYEIAP
ncbi:MAG: hypothetical protein RL701_554 [Pseudomonadota bacterium]|jgi:hypothetical protein